VKKKYIFRFPDRHFRNAEGVKLIKEEIDKLKIIKNFVHFPTPEPRFISFDPNCPFMGYRKLEGIPLSKGFLELNRETKERIAKDIASFLSELHSPNLVKEFANIDYSPKDYHQEWDSYYQKIQNTILFLLEPDQQRWINRLFDDFLSEKENFKFIPKLIHGDFDISNILFNPKTQRISGIVDFEETRIYDPAADFLFYSEGEQFLEKIVANYSYTINTGFRNRMKFLFGRAGLSYIEFGHMTDRPEMIDVGLKMLDARRKRLSTR
jgi:aminoglycoside 2''-phosphotransferase